MSFSRGIVQNVKLELPAFGEFGLDIQAHRMYSMKGFLKIFLIHNECRVLY